MKYIKLILIFFISYYKVSAQQGCKVNLYVRSNEENIPLKSANIRVDGTSYQTDFEGYVSVSIKQSSTVIQVKHMGYKTQSIQFHCSTSQSNTLNIHMFKDVTELDSIFISTGYEFIPKERATGSFEFIDNKLLNRTIGMNVLNRLENITTGIHFNKQSLTANSAGLAIAPRLTLHGVSTLRDHTSRSAPLIILDNFPFEGDINNINPADIESITILKDASATSIWGARAGNGVIVLTSKKAKASEGIKGTFSSSLSIHSKPDLMKHQVIKPSDFIDIEKILFDNGYYRSMETNRSRPALPPAVELFIADRDKTLSIQEINQQLEILKNQDVRDDFNKFLYRNATLQQYNLSLRGSTNKNRFLLSLGYDNSLPTQIGREYQRANIRVDNVYQANKNLDITSSVRWVISNSLMTDGVPVYGDAGYKYPYIRFADDEGNALPIPKEYRLSYIGNTGGGNLLDWYYRPLDEIQNPPTKNITKDLIFNAGLTYKPFSWLSLDAKYQYTDIIDNTRTLYELSHYRTRNHINLGSTLSNNKVTYNFPYGSILENYHSFINGHNGRFQFSINKNWNTKHQINSIAGFEFNSRSSKSDGTKIIGYDENTLTFPTNIDYLKPYPIYDNLQASGTIERPLLPLTELNQRYASFFGNASYSYNNRYTFSMSARKDASNLFGLATNDKWSPLWSVGGKWNLTNEPFFNVDWIQNLALRTTYGFSGNIDNSLAAIPTIRYQSITSQYLTPWQGAQILNAPNLELRWEKVGTFNVGIDFQVIDNRISGTVDIYSKNTKDIYTTVPLDPTTGLLGMVINGANINGKGVDFTVKTVNISKAISWNTNWLFSYNNTWIKRNYKEYTGPNDLLTASINTVEGHWAFPMYSYRWGGLDPQTGEPRGILNGEPSKDYRALRANEVTADDLVFHGSRRPLYWGAIRNDVQYKNWSISANISWKAAYYFRRESIVYPSITNSSYAHSDYYKRWKEPGDEAKTDVPAFIYPFNSQASGFYSNSEILVEKGDHIYLDNIRLDYNCHLGSNIRMNIFGIINNIGTIWSASSSGQLADYNTSIPLPRSFSLGVNLNF